MNKVLIKDIKAVYNNIEKIHHYYGGDLNRFKDRFAKTKVFELQVKNHPTSDPNFIYYLVSYDPYNELIKFTWAVLDNNSMKTPHADVPLAYESFLAKIKNDTFFSFIQPYLNNIYTINTPTYPTKRRAIESSRNSEHGILLTENYRYDPLPLELLGQQLYTKYHTSSAAWDAYIDGWRIGPYGRSDIPCLYIYQKSTDPLACIYFYIAESGGWRIATQIKLIYDKFKLVADLREYQKKFNNAHLKTHGEVTAFIRSGSRPRRRTLEHASLVADRKLNEELAISVLSNSKKDLLHKIANASYNSWILGSTPDIHDVIDRSGTISCTAAYSLDGFVIATSISFYYYDLVKTQNGIDQQPQSAVFGYLFVTLSDFKTLELDKCQPTLPTNHTMRMSLSQLANTVVTLGHPLRRRTIESVSDQDTEQFTIIYNKITAILENKFNGAVQVSRGPVDVLWVQLMTRDGNGTQAEGAFTVTRFNNIYTLKFAERYTHAESIIALDFYIFCESITEPAKQLSYEELLKFLDKFGTRQSLRRRTLENKNNSVTMLHFKKK